MSKVTDYLQRKALEKAPGPALDAVGKVVLKAVDKAVESRWDEALEIAAKAEGDSVDERVRAILKRFKRELTAVGAATGAVAAAPAIGTAAAASALAADLGWFGMRATDLIMAIGAVNGRTESTAEERRAWVLAVLAFGEESAQQFASLVRDVNNTVAPATDTLSDKAAGILGGDALTLEALRRINANLASQVATKYGTRRSALAIGKLLPFGVGAVVGGTANYTFVRVVGKQAAAFFKDIDTALPPAVGDTALSPVDGGPEPPPAAVNQDSTIAPRPRHLSSVPPVDDDDQPPPPPTADSIRYPNSPASIS
ncbi:MAG: EcsC family protein, partial [Acidimicrobiia bacterium]|nr:EcsC family protein [Acidimicrobiia bacterium]